MPTTVGLISRNDLLYSHASTTRYLLLPATKFDFTSLIKEPTITVGSIFASMRILAIIAVVVVFPCVPHIAIVYLSLDITPSASGYEITFFTFFLTSFMKA